MIKPTSSSLASISVLSLFVWLLGDADHCQRVYISACQDLPTNMRQP